MKGKIIKRLHELGIRRADKPGCGTVPLQHIKTSELIRILDKAEKSTR